jgi:hypothetical protein
MASIDKPRITPGRGSSKTFVNLNGNNSNNIPIDPNIAPEAPITFVCELWLKKTCKNPENAPEQRKANPKFVLPISDSTALPILSNTNMLLAR